MRIDQTMWCAIGSFALSGAPVWLVTRDPERAAAWPAWMAWAIAGVAACTAFVGIAVWAWRRRRAAWRRDPRDGVLSRAAATLGLSADQIESLRLESYRRGLDHPLALVLAPGQPARAAAGSIKKKASRQKASRHQG